MTRPERAAELVRRLPRVYPDAHCELNFTNALELLVATILSAQCTDVRVNLVTPALFARCPTARDLAEIGEAELEALIRSTGFYHAKARNLRAMAAELLARHGGEVPRDMTALYSLPGVGRKTANVVLGNAFGLNEGVVVDTHVARLSQRLGLTKQTDPEKIEHGLMRLIPRDVWTLWSHWLIFHGRRRCVARNPDCAGCELNDICPTAFRHGPKEKKRSTGARAASKLLPETPEPDRPRLLP
jgi:endonuclease-3